MKLGYFFQCTAGGVGSKEIKINCHDWAYYVSDQRDLWYKYSVNDECVAITMLNDGMLIPVVRMIRTARPKDNIATWIYVPSKMIISGEILESIINRVKEIVRGSTKAITEATFVNDPILTADFAERKYPKTSCRPEPGSPNAYRTKTPFYSIKEILDNPFQDYYSNYRYIFLFNELPASTEGLVDISDKMLSKTITVLPPSARTISEKFGQDYVQITRQGHLFNAPISASKDEIIELKAIRNGFVPMEFYVQAMNDEEEVVLSNLPQWKKIIDASVIKVKDAEEDTLIKGVVKTFVDSDYDENTHSIPESRLRNVKVRLSASGYKEEIVYVDLTSVPEPVSLKPKVEEVSYSYEMTTGQKIKVICKGKGMGTGCPLQGYNVVNGKLRYEYPSQQWTPDNNPNGNSGKGGRKRKFHGRSFLYGILTAFVIILIGFGVKLLFFSKSDDKAKIVSGEQKTEIVNDAGSQQPDVQSASAAAIAYLDKNDEWHRDSLIKYPELINLFEELNHYDFEKILARENTLSASKNYINLVSHIKSNTDKTFKGTYNDANDFKITVRRYKDNLYDTPYTPDEQAAKPVNNNTDKSSVSDSSKPANPGKTGNNAKVKSSNNQEQPQPDGKNDENDKKQ